MPAYIFVLQFLLLNLKESKLGIKISYDSYIKSIGQITLNFAELEDTLTACVDIMIGGELANIITTRMPFSRLLELLPTMHKRLSCSEIGDALPIELGDLLKRAAKAERKRNDVVHSVWHFETTQESVTRMKKKISRRNYRIEVEHIDLKKLNEVADFIADTTKEFIEFIFSLLEEYITQQISPLDGANINNFTTFSWTAVDRAVAYDFIIARDTSFSQIVVQKQGIEALREAEYTLESEFEQLIWYYWRVRPIIADRKGYWSEVRAFSIRKAQSK